MLYLSNFRVVLHSLGDDVVKLDITCVNKWFVFFFRCSYCCQQGVSMAPFTSIVNAYCKSAVVLHRQHPFMSKGIHMMTNDLFVCLQNFVYWINQAGFYHNNFLLGKAHQAFSENTALSQMHISIGNSSLCLSVISFCPLLIHYCGIQRSSGRTFFPLNLRNVDTAPAMAETLCVFACNTQ